MAIACIYSTLSQALVSFHFSSSSFNVTTHAWLQPPGFMINLFPMIGAYVYAWFLDAPLFQEKKIN